MIAALFITLVVTLFIGIPVGFSIGISCMAYLFTSRVPNTIIVQKMVDGVSSFTLMALPMFMISGAIMAYGSSPRLMRLAKLLLGRVPGGLGAAGCAALGFFGAVSGSGVASTAAVGSIVAPEMVKEGYGKAITASLMAAGGAMASLIPPSLVMVIYGASASVSIGDMFLAGIIPGLMTITGLIVLILILAKKRGYPRDDTAYSFRNVAFIVMDAVLPLIMPVIILGGVMTGIFTPTESAVVATVYAFFLAVFVYRELSLREFMKVAANSAVSSAVILLIISAAAPFGWILATANVPQNFTKFLLGLSSNSAVIYGAITLLILILGTFMETTSIIILMVPILLPIVKNMGIHPVHFGISLLMNTAIGSLTPPLSVCLFTACRILGIRVEDTLPDLLWVILVVFIVLMATILFEPLSMYLPLALNR